MADDDWRYRKAQQLGLIDDRPLGVPGDGRRPDPIRQRPDWPSAAPAMATSASAPRSKRGSPTPADGPRRLAFAGGTALALLVAAGAGWLLNDAVGERAMTDFPPPAIATAAVEATTSPAAAASAALPSADTAPADLPPPVAPPVQPPLEAPPPEAPPLQAPPVETPAPVVATPRAVSSPAARAAAPPKPRFVVASQPGVARRRSDGALAVAARGRPSFNCRRARSRDSQLICASPELSGLDRELARSYRAAVRRGGAGAEEWLDRGQSAFLNARSACQTAPCIARLYYRRLDRLDRG